MSNTLWLTTTFSLSLPFRKSLHRTILMWLPFTDVTATWSIECIKCLGWEFCVLQEGLSLLCHMLLLRFCCWSLEHSMLWFTPSKHTSVEFHSRGYSGTKLCLRDTWQIGAYWCVPSYSFFSCFPLMRKGLLHLNTVYTSLRLLLKCNDAKVIWLILVDRL